MRFKKGRSMVGGSFGEKKVPYYAIRQRAREKRGTRPLQGLMGEDVARRADRVSSLTGGGCKQGRKTRRGQRTRCARRGKKKVRRKGQQKKTSEPRTTLQRGVMRGRKNSFRRGSFTVQWQKRSLLMPERKEEPRSEVSENLHSIRRKGRARFLPFSGMSERRQMRGESGPGKKRGGRAPMQTLMRESSGCSFQGHIRTSRCQRGGRGAALRGGKRS